MRRLLTSLMFATFIIGCESKPKAPNISLDQRSAAPAETDVVSGEVLEHVAAGSYSYLRIRTSAGVVWAAVNAAQIQQGARVTVSSAMLMKDFESKALKRTFDEIYFGSLTPMGDTPAGATRANPHISTSSTVAPFDVMVEKAAGPDARTVAETWAEASNLEGKSVTIRGKVVKYNEAVMGKNWIHLQDGSGDAAQATNDLTVTSLDNASVGETITVTGTVRTNKDFGAGYVYKVLIEDAKVVKPGQRS